MGWLSVFPLAQVPKNSYKECKTKFSIDVEFRISFNLKRKTSIKCLTFYLITDIIVEVKPHNEVKTLSNRQIP